jgi:hypothetical protein
VAEKREFERSELSLNPRHDQHISGAAQERACVLSTPASEATLLALAEEA